MRIQQLSIAVTLLFAIVLGCNDGRSPVTDGELSDASFVATGTVLFRGVEGGCWYIDVDDNGRLEPFGMPPEFYEEGLNVRFRARVIEGVVTTCQVGTPVEILEIERI